MDKSADDLEFSAEGLSGNAKTIKLHCNFFLINVDIIARSLSWENHPYNNQSYKNNAVNNNNNHNNNNNNNYSNNKNNK